MRSLAASLAALLLAAPAVAAAQPVSEAYGPGPDTYLELHLGGFLPQSDDFEDVSPGVAFGGTFGARFTPHVSAEVELAYYRASDSASGLDLDLQAVPVTASLRLRIPLKVAELSAFAGGGIHFASFSVDTPLGDSSNSDTAFGFHVGAAAGFHLSPTMRVGFEARRTFVEATFGGADLAIDGLRLAATLGYHF